MPAKVRWKFSRKKQIKQSTICLIKMLLVTERRKKNSKSTILFFRFSFKSSFYFNDFSKRCDKIYFYFYFYLLRFIFQYFFWCSLSLSLCSGSWFQVDPLWHGNESIDGNQLSSVQLLAQHIFVYERMYLSSFILNASITKMKHFFKRKKFAKICIKVSFECAAILVCVCVWVSFQLILGNAKGTIWWDPTKLTQLGMRLTNTHKHPEREKKTASSQSFDSWIFVSRLCLSMHMKGKRYSLSELKAITK